ncbi:MULTISPECIES: VOC family protein [Frankia]|jgi:catechol 2,3-dioxygenase-like lactoylglutathione lyase family enzyme|uniref:Glyoxalase/fosfomycin resistance/dioxygenase domain-containing protein n=1 Tax=Frankia alni (strain DSM 45986 / CECT 9034 / ACN14a) TaxID=326424 RepID=Q0RBZ0_FRAAA|nr:MULTISPECIES: VOC family protein [Frankia]CAJ65040.1 hypothetical protein FRAAL6417 [Frankia alni ACN14a]
MTAPEIDLVVIYCADLAACRDFYQRLGLTFRQESHGNGPEHFSTTLAGGTVVELYPAAAARRTDHLRLGLTVRQDATRPRIPLGRHVIRDPEGRAVDVRVV